MGSRLGRFFSRLLPLLREGKKEEKEISRFLRFLNVSLSLSKKEMGHGVLSIFDRHLPLNVYERQPVYPHHTCFTSIQPL